MIEIKPFSPSSIPEEVFASDGAIWWSTTGKYFAYAEFNDTEVQKVEFSWYGSGQYAETRAIPYPKVRLEDSACVRKTSTFREKNCLFWSYFYLWGRKLIVKVTSCRVGAGRICPHEGEAVRGGCGRSFTPSTGGCASVCCFRVSLSVHLPQREEAVFFSLSSLDSQSGLSIALTNRLLRVVKIRL